MERSNTTRNVIAVVVVAVVVLGAIGLLYFFFRPAPAAVGVVGPASSVTASADPSVAASEEPAASADPGTSGEPVAGLDGTWTVDPSIGSFDYDAEDFSSSFVGYRVQEELAGIGGATAVGRTPDVTGSLTFDGTQVTGVEITADLSTLESDSGPRDGQLRRQALETDEFPQATFSLTQPVDLGSVPADGSTVEVQATGDLTIHGQTRSVTIPMTATLNGDTVTVAGSTDIVFADYGMNKPEAARVLSVDDHGIMEFQLHFTRG